MSEDLKLGFWKRQHPAVKFLIVAGTITIICVGINQFSKKKENIDKPKKQNDSDKKENVVEKEAPASEPILESKSPQVEEKKEEQIKKSQSSKDLPNDGVDCGEVITTYDRNYNYVKSKGTWYLKSKEKPANNTLKVFNSWMPLKEKSVMTERLNSRYPN